MSTPQLARKIQPDRRPATAIGVTPVQAIVALCLALVVVTLVAYPAVDDPDSAVSSVAGP